MCEETVKLNSENENREVFCVNLPYIFENFTPLIVPSYQRGYAWEEKNINDLISDIEDARDSVSYKHFTGTIVLAKENSENPAFDIIDGQQRLTSLFILMKAIYDKTKNKDIYDNYIVKQETLDTKSRLRQACDTNGFFENYIVRDDLDAVETIYSHKRIKAAKQSFDKWLSDKNSDDIERIITTIKNKLRFIVYVPHDSVNASAMFEIINNRGKNLSELEKIKNYFVYLAMFLGKDHTLHETINKSWGDMLKYLNYAQVYTVDEENSFLRFCFITFFSSVKDKYQHIYKTLKEELFPAKMFISTSAEYNQKNVLQKIEELKNFLKFLVSASKYYACLLKCTNLNRLPATDAAGERLKKNIEYLSCHPSTAAITPLYLAITCKAGLDNTAKQELLEILEKLNFRMFVLPGVLSRTDNGQSSLFSLAHDFYGSKEIDAQKLKDSLLEIVTYWSPLKKIGDSLSIKEDEQYDYATWSGLRYFLARYEEYLEKENHKTFEVSQITKSRQDCESGDYLSVEHIWAKESKTNYADKNYYAKRRLGNFVLLELRTNIQAGNNDIEEKLKLPENLDIDNRVDILKTSLYQGQKLAGIFNQVSQKLNNEYRRKGKGYYCDLGNKLAEHREQELIKFAKETWKISDIETEK